MTRQHLAAGCAFLVACAAIAAPATAAGPNAAVKAAFIYNFVRFTQWGTSANAARPVVLCVDGDDPIAPALLGLQGKSVGARSLAVRRTTPRAGVGCDVAFVSARDASPTNLAALRAGGVLTIGETGDFTKFGSIRLLTIGNQVQFEISLTNVRAAGLNLSSQLIRASVRVS